MGVEGGGSTAKRAWGLEGLGLDRDFERPAAVHLVERFLVVLELEHIRDLQKKAIVGNGPS